MFVGFNLNISENFFVTQSKSFEEYQKIGKEHIEVPKKTIEKSLEKYVNDDVIAGSKMQNDWFPEINADIFLSHSSKDKKLVNAIAGWIHDKFDLNCFIDSNVWCYAGDLSDKLNDSYSNKEDNGKGGFLYNHKKCLKVSEHVNTMLNIALQRMIDKCECIFLINTENSISIKKDSKNIDITYSPWIYSELVCSEIVRKKSLCNYRYKKELYHSP